MSNATVWPGGGQRDRRVLALGVIGAAHVVLSLVGMLASVVRSQPADIVGGAAAGAAMLALAWPVRRGKAGYGYVLLVLLGLMGVFWGYLWAVTGTALAPLRLAAVAVGLWLAAGLTRRVAGRPAGRSASPWAAESRSLFLRRF